MYPRAPAVRACTTCDSLPSVVIITIGIPLAHSNVAAWRTNSSPSMTGMLISHRMRSTLLLCNATSASAPFEADFKLFPRLLIHVRRPQHAVLVFHRGQRNRARDLRAGAFRRLHDLARRLIQNAIVVGFQPNANSFFSSHCSLSFCPSRLNPGGKIWRQAASRVSFLCGDGASPRPGGAEPRHHTTAT